MFHLNSIHSITIWNTSSIYSEGVKLSKKGRWFLYTKVCNQDQRILFLEKSIMYDGTHQNDSSLSPVNPQ